VLLWLMLFSAVVLPFYALRKAAGFSIVAGFLLLVLASLVYLNRGHVKVASWIFLSCMWLMVTIALMFSGGITNRGTMFYVVISVTAAWLVGERVALISAGLFVVVALIMALLELSGVTFRRYFPGSPIAAWMLVVLFTALAILPVNQILRSFREALKQARETVEELNHREVALQESNDRCRLALETGRMFAFEWNPETDEVWRTAGCTEILGVNGNPTREAGRSSLQRIHPEDQEGLIQAYKTLTPNINSYKIEYRVIHSSGRTVWVQQNARAIFDSGGRVLRLVGITADITERKCAQEMENQLASDLAASDREIRALAASLMKAQEDERRRISRELHDQICHQLGSLAVDIGNLEVSPLAPEDLRAHLTAIRARMVRTSRETHDIAYQMHTAILDDLGLVASLNALCRQFSEQYPNIAVDFKNSGPPTSIPSEVATCLYRVAQESLQNVDKHSSAKNVSVRLDFKQGAIVLTIQDDGAGFDPKTVKSLGGIGLISMKERAYAVNGKLTITAQPGHGAQITVEIPLF
jgi:signal transduction histidine kinase